MEFEEHRDDYKESSLDQDCDCTYNEANRYGLGLADDFRYFSNKERDFAGEGEDESNDDIEDEEHKVLSVRKTYAISYPRAVVIHI